jgi:hypothetical protein
MKNKLIIGTAIILTMLCGIFISIINEPIIIDSIKNSIRDK